MKKGRFIKKWGIAFLPCLLLSFMLLVFGPSEIFFSNVSQFEFKFEEFIWIAAGLMAASSIVVSLIIALLPKKIYYVLMASVLSVGVLGYCQVMFLNKNLDLLGQNPNGYSATTGLLVVNTIIWIVVIGLCVFFAIKKSELFAKVCAGASVILILVQIVAFVSLIIGAGEEAYKRPETSWFITGKEQLMASTDENVIVIVLDYFSNEYLEPTLEKYPDALDGLHDFTYYNNTDCTYFGTFPSMLHMLTGAHVDNTVSINDWTKTVIEDPNYRRIFDTIHDKGYKINVFTTSSDIYRAGNDPVILNGLFDNLTNEGEDVTVNQKLLIKTVTKMSTFRMSPEILKNLFYTQFSEYESIVQQSSNPIRHGNADFLEGLKEEGLRAVGESKYFMIQHLEGDHERKSNADGTVNEDNDSSLEDNSKGCLVAVNEYLNQLKKIGAYDNSTIIITSDHGSPTEPQVIFFMKKPGETHEEIITTDAPISHCDLLPTIIDGVGADGHEFGTPVTDYKDGDKRDRIFWLCTYDEQFPYINNFSGDKEAAANCMYGYYYNGDYRTLKEKLNGNPDAILPLVDSFF